jgi:hypothetical protein
LQYVRGIASNSKFRTILRRFRDRPDCQKLLTPLGVRLAEASNFEFGIAAVLLEQLLAALFVRY